MKTFIAILRGINVGAHRIIKMHDLQQMMIDVGFKNIQTYIQSGNMVFQSKMYDRQDLEVKIFKAIKTKFDFEVPVMVIDLEEFNNIVIENPFLYDTSKNQEYFHLTFLSGKPNQIYIDKINENHAIHEEFILRNNVVYIYCPEGYSKSKLTNSFFETKLKVKASTRYWKTIIKLQSIAFQMSLVK